MLGQNDADSGEPMQASTDWGTNSARIRDAISIECDNSHSHQRVEGSTSRGLRSVQQAEWPRDACKQILSAQIQLLDDRSYRVAFAGEIVEEDRQEFGPLDAPEEDADDTPPPIETDLSKVAEDEMEFLDSLKMKGFPVDEAQRRRRGWNCLELLVLRFAGCIIASATDRTRYLYICWGALEPTRGSLTEYRS